MLVAKYGVVPHDLLVATVQRCNEVVVLLGHSAVGPSARCGPSGAGSLLLLVVIAIIW